MQIKTTKVETLADVRIFIHELCNNLVFHPDTPMQDYILAKTDEPTFTKKEAKRLNRLMAQCFDICEKEGQDIYGISIEADRLVQIPEEWIENHYILVGFITNFENQNPTAEFKDSFHAARIARAMADVFTLTYDTAQWGADGLDYGDTIETFFDLNIQQYIQTIK